MSHTDLVDAYRRGRISRRTFIRGMVALGATVTMANSAADAYAAPQRPAGAAAVRAQDDVYGEDDGTGGTTGGTSSGGTSSGGTTSGGSSSSGSSSSGSSSSGSSSSSSTLPRTGIGSAAGASGSWLKPATLVAGAAALAVAGLRRLKGTEVEGK